ncbi:MAG: flagellar filament capping protein FliD [Gammaproteobacteria bacterium]|nr:flagellar filament capping protein FliD [Gammaproteobacteria bacterium]NNJ71729.1 flagellar filament capping protein FliD [Enterobacterales bacterium]
MGLITSAGVGSGIDIESIIRAILEAERAPKEASLQRNSSRVDSTLSAIGQLSSALSTLDDALTNLNSLEDFRLRSAVSSDEEFLTATANAQTSTGNFNVEVSTIAQGSRLESAASLFTEVTDTVGQGILTFTAGTDTFDITVGATDSLETIRDNINNSGENFGVNANIINSANGPILVYTSSITGDGNTLTISNDNSSLDNISTAGMSTTQNAASATAIIDGITVTSDSNTFTDAIQDLSFTVVKVTEANSPITLSVDVDKEGVKETLNSFIGAFNDFQTISQRLGASSESSSGQLAGDITLRLLSRQVFTTIQDSVSGLTGDFTSLNSLGITFDDTGKLQLDEDSIDSVLNTNFDAISNVFASPTGVSIKLQDLIANYVGSGSILDVRESSLTSQQRQLEDDRLRFEFRMTQIETQLRNKFSAMDTLVAQFNNTSSFLSQQLANLPNNQSNN